MPSGVFKPYAGVSTGVLVFTKGEPTKKVWFYDMTADGFSLDDKRTFIDGKGDIPDIIEKFNKKFNKNFTNDYRDTIQELIKLKLCSIEKGFFKLTKTGIMLANRVFEYFV